MGGVEREMIGITSGASRFNIDKFSQVLGLCGMERIVSNRYDFVVDALLYFEPVQCYEYRGDMFSFVVLVLCHTLARIKSVKNDFRRF